ncbi:uncharacterized protein F5891DRAFT_984416 [Suillus fuscotomentosus]|uniref:KOW domain-containing protein n=1 Tax=Suillus fuscotomentosus TaxID=1912939 RepID=A0AAD4DW49_9AGAM|nr:uncharacterized protein F5891DRAFT_984416 [Suillus fuscotomentosus]KAG1895209.1 hypothetical protein F5891DRAFT_984416 [Suillus fuscotomentosus]
MENTDNRGARDITYGMSKSAACSDDDHAPSRMSTNDRNCRAAPSPLADEGAWRILEQFLTTDMTYPQMENAFSAYLGGRYIADDWKDARDALFSGDGNDSIALANLYALKAKHIPLPSSSSRVNSRLSSTPIQQPRKRPQSRTDSSTRVQQPRKRLKRNPYIITEADESEREEVDVEDEVEVEDAPSVRLPKVAHFSGPSAKDRLASAFDNIFDRIGERRSFSLETHSCKAASFSRAIEGRMYLLHVQRNGADYIAEHLRSQGFPVTVSAWAAGQLYVVADSPKAISTSLPASHSFAVKQYIRISDEERQAVEHLRSKLPDPGWVRIKYGKYKGDMGYVFDSDQSNGFVTVLIALRDFPYPMPGHSVALLDRSRLPNNDQAVRDIIRDGKVAGCSYKGELYYMGLLAKQFHRDRLEIVASPHADDIRLHMQSGWDTPFVKKTLLAFSMQFLRAGDPVKIIAGGICSEASTVVSTDHAIGSARLEITLDGHRREIDVRLEDIERVFRVGDEVRVVAGPYLGLEGHIIQICDDEFHVCQAVSKEEVLVSRYYLDRCPLHHTFQASLPTRQHFEPCPESDSIEVGDHIEVLAGEHWRKCGVVEWFSMGGTMLWFRDMNFTLAGDDVKSSVVPSRIQVPATVVRRTKLPDTLKYTQERGYDVRPGDVIDVPIGFVIKVIGQEVFIVGGERKGYRATLYGVGSETCRVAVHGQPRITLSRQDVVTSYGMRLNGAMLEGPDLVSFCNIRRRSYTIIKQHRSIAPPPIQLPASSSTSADSSLPSWTSWTDNQEGTACHESSNITLSSSTFDPWIVNPQDTQDNIDARAEKLRENGPLPWLMGKEYSSTFLLHHAVLKVSAGFMGGRLHKRFVSMACPDPFCGANGPAPEDCVAVFCTSSNAGAALQHYHIPARDLSPAPPRKKNQLVFVLEGAWHSFRVFLAKNSGENPGEEAPWGI